MPTIETIRRIRVQQISEGGDAVRRDLQATADAQQKLGDVVNSSAVITDLASKKTLSAAGAFDRWRLKVDESFRAAENLRRGLENADRALQQGATDVATYERQIGLLQTRFGAAAKEAQAFEAAQRAAAQATIQAREAQEAAAASYQKTINQRLGVGGGGGGGGAGEDRAAAFEAAAAAGDKLRAKYDQMFAAAQRYAATVKEVTDAERAGILTTEIANDARQKATRSYNDQIQVLERIAQVQKESAQRSVNSQLVVPDRGGDIEAYAKSLDALQAKFDPLFAAEQSYIRTVEELDKALSVGAISQGVYNARFAEQGALLDAAVAKINGVVDAQTKAAQATALAASAQEQFNKLLGVRDDFGTESRAADIDAYGQALSNTRAKYDPLYRAQQQYLSGLQDLRQAFAAGAISQEVFNTNLAQQKDAFADQIKALNGVVEIQGAAARSASDLRAAWSQLGEQGRTAFQNIQASNKLGSLSNMSGTVRDDSANAALQSQINAAAQKAGAEAEAYAASLTKQRAALVPMFAVTQQFEAAQESANKALEAGIIDQGEFEAAVARARNTLLAQTNELRKAEDANARLAKGVGLSAYGWQNLSFQINDVVTSLASGISPMQTFAQQGGQIFQVLQGGQGGVRGALAGIGETAMSVARRIGPVGGAFAGVTAAVLAGVTAQQSYASTQTALAQNLSGVGRASGATVAQINAVASASAAAGGVSVRSAREMAGEFAATGKIGTEMYGGLIGSVKDYAATTGQSVPDATKALAEAFADPAKGADTLDKQLAILNDTTRENIQRLAAQGDRLGAQKLLLDTYKSGLTSATELTSAWGRTTAAVGATISDVWDKVGGAVDKAVTGGSLEERLATAQKVLENSRARSAGAFGSLLPGVASRDERLAQDEVNKLKEDVRKRDERIQQAQQNQTSTRIGDYVRALDPANEQIKKISDMAKDIATNFAKLPFDEQGNARRAMEGLLTQAKQLREDLMAGGSGFADALRTAGFQQRTIGFTQQGLSAATINENAANKEIDVRRQGGNQSDINARLQSIEQERVTLLQSLEKSSTLEGNQIGGAFSRMSQSVQAQIIAAGQQFGKVPAALIAGIADKESGGNANIGGTKVLGPDGRPSTSAYGLGQITRGTAADAIRNGYLPSTFDRTDPAQGAAGIAGVFQMKLDQAGGDQFKALKNYYGSKDDAANTAYANDVLRRAGQMGDPSSLAQGRDQDAYTRALRDQNDTLRNVTQNYGQNGLALEATAEATKRYNALLDAGVPASDALAASIKGLATQTASAAQQIKLQQFASDTGFQRDQLGRTAAEGAAYSQARSLVGDTSSASAQFVIAQSQALDTLKQVKDTSQGAFSGIITDLSHGTSVANAFASALNKIGDKLIQFGTDAIFSKLFGSILGGGSSGGGGGGGFDLFGGIGKLFGFADGGYTGHGGKYEPAGIVHRGEYVIDSGTVSRIGRGFFDGLRGYADGGFVEMPDMKAPLAPIAANANGPQQAVDARQFSFDLRGSNLSLAEVDARVRSTLSSYDQEQRRTQFDRQKADKRAFG
jgi:phage-related minor tail protein